MAGHIKKREWLDGKALSSDAQKRKQQVREITARARAAGRTLAPIRSTYQARIPSEQDRRKDDVKSFDRKRDAERWLAEESARRVTGDTRDSTKPFSELVATWERTRAAKLAPKTRERYAGIVANYLLPEWGRTPLAKLDRPKIKEWFADLDASPGQAKKVHTVLSSILSEAVELRLLRDNPAARLGLATPPRHDMTILTAEEVRSLAEAMPRPSDRLAVYVAAYCGLRAGEQWALRCRDIDLPRRQLSVTRTLHEARGHLEFRNTTKSDGSRRAVSLPIFLANMLETHLATLPADPNALLFTAPGGGNGREEGDGGPIRHGLFVRRVFKPALKGKPAVEAKPAKRGRAAQPARPAVPGAVPADKAKLRWHDLRDTCASLLIHNGASILLVSKRLGHAAPSMTLDRYGWLYPSAEAALTDALDATFNTVMPLRREAA